MARQRAEGEPASTDAAAENPPSGATAAPADTAPAPLVTGAATARASAAGMAGGIAGTARAGAAAQGTDFGNPYDPDAPPYPVYRDPAASGSRSAERKAQQVAEARASAKGAEVYQFDGVAAAGDGTTGVTLPDGTTVFKGEKLHMTAKEAEALKGAGFKFSKVEEEVS